MDVRHLQFDSWLDGFLSGYNWWAPQAPPGGIYKTDAAGAKAFLAKFCRDNPTATFAGAVKGFISSQGGTVSPAN
jgi:hypothetical protein